MERTFGLLSVLTVSVVFRSLKAEVQTNPSLDPWSGAEFFDVTSTLGTSMTYTEGETLTVDAVLCWNVSVSFPPRYFSMNTWSEDDATATVASNSSATPFLSNGSTCYRNRSVEDAVFSGNVTISAVRLGTTMILIKFVPHWDTTSQLANRSDIYLTHGVEIRVVRQTTMVDTVFTVLLTVFIIVNNFVFGCAFNFEVASETFRRPLALLIGFGCQAVLLPLLAFGYGHALHLSPAIAFSLLATGSSPGGGQSNVYTILLDGDLTLSVSLTVISSLLSFGTMPLWLLTLGKTIFEEDITIPYGSILVSLLPLILPLLVGLILRRFLPKIATPIAKAVRPLSLIFVVFLCTFGIYVYRYVFSFIFNDWRILVAGFLLPWTGIVISGMATFVCCKSWEKVKTIAIETAIQNSALTLLVLRKSLPQPEADVTSVVPIACLLMAPLPFIVAIIGKMLVIAYRRTCHKKDEDDKDNAKEKPPGGCIDGCKPAESDTVGM